METIVILLYFRIVAALCEDGGRLVWTTTSGLHHTSRGDGRMGLTIGGGHSKLHFCLNGGVSVAGAQKRKNYPGEAAHHIAVKPNRSQTKQPSNQPEKWKLCRKKSKGIK